MSIIFAMEYQEKQMTKTALVKVAMEPKSLCIEVPLNWELAKIKVMLMRMLPRFDFDSIHFLWRGGIISGATLVSQLSQGEQIVLGIVRAEGKIEQSFQKYYLSKIHPLVKSLESSPYQPVLHPGYQNLKATVHLNRLPFQGGKELIQNFNQLRQVQNVVEQQRLQNAQVGVAGGAEGQMGGDGWGANIVTIVIRILQGISAFTILRFLAYNCNSYTFVGLGFIILLYFFIDFFKPQNPRAQEQKPQLTIKDEMRPANPLIRFIVIVLEEICGIIEAILSFSFSLFPNWTVETHREWLHQPYNSISARLNSMKMGSSDDAQQNISKENIPEVDEQKREELHKQGESDSL